MMLGTEMWTMEWLGSKGSDCQCGSLGLLPIPFASGIFTHCEHIHTLTIGNEKPVLLARELMVMLSLVQ